MNEGNLTLVLSLGVPLIAAAIGWFALWRRNIIIYKRENTHFCGDELTKAGFWKDKQKRRPLIDTFNLYFFNFGLKHLDSAEFIIFNVSDDFVVHPFHHNGIPENKWEYKLLEDNKLYVNIRDIPAFEKFGFSLLNTHPTRSGGMQGSGKAYRFVSRKVYLKHLLRLLIGITAIAIAVKSALLLIK